jgi:hypothetical protein
MTSIRLWRITPTYWRNDTALKLFHACNFVLLTTKKTMETQVTINMEKQQSKAMLWTGRIISTITILFLLMDSIMKIFRESHHIEGTVKLGFTDAAVQPIGITLLVCTILYIIPRTAVLGAILLTAYLGGAVAIMARVGEPFYFPIIFGVLVWCGLFFRDMKIRNIIPIKRDAL